MRILIVSQYFHPENFRINQLAVVLRESGHEVVVVTGQPNYPSGRFFAGYSFFWPLRERYEGIEVIRVPLIPRGRGRWWQLALNYASFVVSATFFGLPRARGRFDACIAWCSSPITIAIPASIYRFFRKTPVAVWVQDIWPETFFAVTRSRNRFIKSALGALVRWIYAHVDQIWIQSPAYEASVRAHGGKSEQIEYVPNWAEDLYDGEKWKSVVPDQIPPNSLVFAGNLGRAQGLETLMDAAEITRETAPEAHWVFVGDGSLREWLVDEVKKRKLEKHVSFFPRRAPTEIPKVLKPAAAALVTLGNDQVYAMTIPSKIQSCLASGKPLLGTLAGEPARVIQQAECGLVCAPNDARQLAKTVKDFLQLPEEERTRMGRSGHAFYKAHFTQERIVTRIVELLERMGSK